MTVAPCSLWVLCYRARTRRTWAVCRPIHPNIEGAAVRLASLKIANHARIPDLELDVREHLVLVGPNASGKTSVLHALNLVLAGTMAQLYASIGRSHIRDESQPMTIE